MPSLTPSEPPRAPDPVHSHDPRFEFARWALADAKVWRRILVLVTLFLVAAVVISVVLAPHIGTIGGAVGGVVGGTAAVGGVKAGRRKLRERREQ